MLAQLVGIRPVDFTDDNGNRIKGTSLFVNYDDEHANGLVGSIAAKVFYRGDVPAQMVGALVDLVYEFHPGMRTPRLADVKQVSE